MKQPNDSWIVSFPSAIGTKLTWHYYFYPEQQLIHKYAGKMNIIRFRHASDIFCVR